MPNGTLSLAASFCLVALASCANLGPRPAERGAAAPATDASQVASPTRVASAGPARSATSAPSAPNAAALAEQPAAASSPPAMAAAPPPPKSYLTSVRYKTWIWAKPIKKGRFLGYMRVGQRVALRSEERVRGQGCPAGFYRIEPRGFVCKDRTITLARQTPFLKANAHSDPDESALLPYRYAISNGAPMYSRLPSAPEQRRREWIFGPAGKFRRLPLFQRGHEQLATTQEIRPTDPIPKFLRAGDGARGPTYQVLRRNIPHGAMLAYTRSFDVEGRTFLLSTDLTVVPADRVRKFRVSRFQGVALDDSTQLPLAWFRRKARPQYQVSESGEVVAKAERFEVRSFVALDGGELNHQGKRYLKLRDGRLTAASDATVVRAYGKLPFGVQPKDKWILVSISQGTLVAYEGLRPVFATLISPGMGGVPRRGGDLVKDSTTPLGSYRITFKDRAATMSPEQGEQRRFWIADVPFTQYFRAPFALHTAFWHEAFGEPMSGGCVNLSPRDGRWLFDWTLPHVPAGWQGATGAGAPENGGATWVVIRR